MYLESVLVGEKYRLDYDDDVINLHIHGVGTCVAKFEKNCRFKMVRDDKVYLFFPSQISYVNEDHEILEAIAFSELDGIDLNSVAGQKIIKAMEKAFHYGYNKAKDEQAQDDAGASL